MNPVLQLNIYQHGKLKNSRASTQKVRTGCITCKRRHIKCDETKPYCLNCLRVRGHCEGYVTKPRKNATGPVQICWNSRQGAHNTAPRMMQLQVDPDSIDFRDASAFRYFQEFVGLVQGPWINATSNDDFWEVTLPQLARTDDVLRSAATAIGALSIWHSQPGRGSLRSVSVPASPTEEGDMHYFHAVAYYCHSIKLQSQRASPQGAVILSLLLLFFERLRGNRQAALDHVNHGLNLLLALLTEKDAQFQVTGFVPHLTSPLRAVADIFVRLATQTRTVIRGRTGQGPSLPNLARELPKRKHTTDSFMLLLSKFPQSAINTDQIPAVFNTVDEFRKYWTTGHHRQTKIISIMAETIRNLSQSASKDEDTTDSFFLELFGNPRIKEFCDDSWKDLQKLDAAFLPFFNRIIMSDNKSPAYLRAIHVRLQYLASYVIEDPTLYLDVETVRSRTPLFREYLSLTAIALCTAKQEIRNPAHQLSLQCGLAWYVLLVALFCRDPLTRDEAMWMLRDYPGQDGLWNTCSLYLVALRNRHIERTNALEGTPAEQWRRLWRREFVFEDCGNRILLRYLEKDQAAGKWQLIEEVAEVDSKSESGYWARQPLLESKRLLMGDLYAA